MISKTKKQNGITLIALVVTIVVLLILAAISIGVLTGENGIIIRTKKAKEENAISEEKEILGIATVQASEKHVLGVITRKNLQIALDKNTAKGVTNVIEDEDVFLTTFVESGRVYEVDKDGIAKYVGQEKELLEQVTITANPEKNMTPQLIQKVELTVTTPLSIDNENITLVYAWSNGKNTKPKESEYIKEELGGTKRIKKTKVASNATTEGNYYLWTKVIINEKQIEKTFGPYAIKEHTTLVACNYENVSTSPFLGSKNITRGEIESVTIATSLGGHTTADENCWDVSAKQNRAYLAWYEDNDSDGYYEVTIAGEGKVVANSNSQYLFRYIGYNGDDTTVFYGLENLDTGIVTNMESLFSYSRNIISLRLNQFDTNEVMSMAGMFSSCENMTSVDLGGFNTQNVRIMTGMFYGCKNLTNLDVSNFVTSNVIRMDGMFGRCQNLVSIKLEKFDTKQVINMSEMFYDCDSLESLDVTEFDTSSVTDMNVMFYHCGNLVELDVSGFDTSNVINMNGVFQFCYRLTSIDVSRFDTSKVTNMACMFSYCSSLTNLDVSRFDTSNVKDMNNMFYYCRNLTSLDITNFETKNVENMSGMFYYCRKLTNLDISNFDTGKVMDMSYMFWRHRRSDKFRYK